MTRSALRVRGHHDLVFAERRRGDRRGQDQQHPGFGVQFTLADDFIERPVVEKLDELRIRLWQFGFVIREKFLVVLDGVLGEAKFFHGVDGSWSG